LKALVTGGGGFLGQALVGRLLDGGHTATVLGRGEYPELLARGVRCLRGDVADRAAVMAAAEGCEIVFHCAARPGVWGERALYLRTNVTGTENVIAACLEQGVPRLVYTSSPSVVFDGRDHEDAANDLAYPERYECHYPETKAIAERQVLAANGPRLATVSLRPHLIYGPADPHLLPRLLARARRRRLVVVGDGRNRVSLTYVDNAAAAHVQAALRLEPGAAAAGRAFFVNDAEPVRLWEWLDRLLGRLGLARAERRVPLSLARAVGAVLEGAWSALSLPGEPPMTRFVASQLARSHTYSLRPACEAFGYAPPVTGEEAFERTVAWWSARIAAADAGPVR
jgi:nucleoside-diphosphate-sugar epimerase